MLKQKFLLFALVVVVVVVVAALSALLFAVIKLLNDWYYRVDDPAMRKLRLFFKLPWPETVA